MVDLLYTFVGIEGCKKAAFYEQDAHFPLYCFQRRFYDSYQKWKVIKYPEKFFECFAIFY